MEKGKFLNVSTIYSTLINQSVSTVDTLVIIYTRLENSLRWRLYIKVCMTVLNLRLVKLIRS